jgi:hypothetical protein
MMPQTDHLRRIRFWLAVFIAGLVLSGVTAFPLQSELNWLVSFLHAGSLQPMAESTGMLSWIERVYIALSATNARYSFLAYGTDWLAFAHLVIAAAFIGPYVDPVRTRWFLFVASALDCSQFDCLSGTKPLFAQRFAG